MFRPEAYPAGIALPKRNADDIGYITATVSRKSKSKLWICGVANMYNIFGRCNVTIFGTLILRLVRDYSYISIRKAIEALLNWNYYLCLLFQNVSWPCSRNVCLLAPCFTFEMMIFINISHEIWVTPCHLAAMETPPSRTPAAEPKLSRRTNRYEKKCESGNISGFDLAHFLLSQPYICSFVNIAKRYTRTLVSAFIRRSLPYPCELK